MNYIIINPGLGNYQSDICDGPAKMQEVATDVNPKNRPCLNNWSGG